MAGGALYLGLDVGTQGTKGLVLDAEARAVVGRAARAYDLIRGLPDGAAEQHPDTWWEAVRGVVGELVACGALDPERLAGIGVSGQQHGLVALDVEDRVLRPAKLWCDTTTSAEAAELSHVLGRVVPAGFTAPKILWMKRREPALFARLATVLLPHDWIDLRLTGGKTMEAGDASGTGLLDVRERRWDRAACAAIDPRLAEMLPPLSAPGDPAGELTAAAADELGLHPGAIVASGGGDNMLSAIGAGATRPGVSVLSLGTSATVFGRADRPVVDPAGAIAAFCDSTGGWLPLLCVMNATGVLTEVARTLGRDLDDLTAAAADVPPGSDGLLLLPFFQGERVPELPDARGALLGVTPANFTPGHLFRSALEGVALNLAWGVERLRGLGLAVDHLRVVGGGARNELWLRILADALDATVQRTAEPESAALGGALQAIWTVARARGEDASIDALAQRYVELSGEEIVPEAEGREAYRRLGGRFREETERAFGVGG